MPRKGLGRIQELIAAHHGINLSMASTVNLVKVREYYKWLNGCEGRVCRFLDQIQEVQDRRRKQEWMGSKVFYR